MRRVDHIAILNAGVSAYPPTTISLPASFATIPIDAIGSRRIGMSPTIFDDSNTGVHNTPLRDDPDDSHDAIARNGIHADASMWTTPQRLHRQSVVGADRRIGPH
jgi:hypothetical protein